MTSSNINLIRTGNGPYIRFGFIPEDERSNIYCGDVVVGKEIGVSCYECLKIDDKYRLIYPPFNNRWDKSAMVLNILIKRFMNHETKCFLVDGVVVGRGTDNEPLLNDVKVIRELNSGDLTHDLQII